MTNRIRRSEVALVLGARFIAKLLPFTIISTVLVICAILYAIAWFFGSK
ncbi:MAG: hypothetical protein HY721_02820 [Planctomycetes bacterium]|nr:hypothetical protein [Planctomycetota bacterium]